MNTKNIKRMIVFSVAHFFNLLLFGIVYIILFRNYTETPIYHITGSMDYQIDYLLYSVFIYPILSISLPFIYYKFKPLPEISDTFLLTKLLIMAIITDIVCNHIGYIERLLFTVHEVTTDIPGAQINFGFY